MHRPKIWMNIIFIKTTPDKIILCYFSLFFKKLAYVTSFKLFNWNLRFCYYQIFIINNRINKYLMIVSERTRIYVDEKGQREKVDILTSYRRVGVAATPLPIQGIHNGGYQSTIWNIIKWVIFSLAVVGIASTVIETQHLLGINIQPQIQFSSCSANLLNEQNYSRYHANRSQLDSFSIYLKQNARPATIWEYKVNGHQSSVNYQQLQAQMLDRLTCSWENGKILCQINLQNQDSHRKI